jgi:hypothetical protein
MCLVSVFDINHTGSRTRAQAHESHYFLYRYIAAYAAKTQCDGERSITVPNTR